MEIFETIKQIKSYLKDKRSKGKTIGFVPTMGALHYGHLSLVRAAKEENDIVICSIFVNPIQFNNEKDLEKYPRVFDSDIKLLKEGKCEVVFHPSVEEMYPESSNEVFDFGELDKVMEGKFRPEHFNGVATVVKKLFEIVEPHRAYFGLKDYQQLIIIHKMTKDLGLPVEIVPCSTVREDDGLALSSRNQLLSDVERNQASEIYDILKSIKLQAGYESISEIKRSVERFFKKNKFFRFEYFEIVDMYSLKPLGTWAESKNVVACIAVYMGNVRLIDNIILFS